MDGCRWKQFSFPGFVYSPKKVYGLDKRCSEQDVVDFCSLKTVKQLGVSQNGGTPKWMVYNGKPY